MLKLIFYINKIFKISKILLITCTQINIIFLYIKMSSIKYKVYLFLSLFDIYLFYRYITYTHMWFEFLHVWMYVCVSYACLVLRGKKRTSYPLELELRMSVSHHVGIKPESSTGATRAPNCWAISPAPSKHQI